MFSQNLRKLRELMGLSQMDVASRIGIAITTYRNYENTLRQPDYQTLVKIANILDTTTDFLLGNDKISQSNTQLSSLFSGIQFLSQESLVLLENYLELLLLREKVQRSQNFKK